MEKVLSGADIVNAKDMVGAEMSESTWKAELLFLDLFQGDE